MLQVIRGRSASIIVKALFVILILSFGAWGIADYATGPAPGGVMARVGDTEIDAVAVQRALNGETQDFAQRFGHAPDEQTIETLGLLDRAVRRLVQATALDAAASDLGLGVSDAQVRAEIERDPRFRNQSGRFDPALFESALYQLNLSEAEMVGLLRSAIMRRALFGGIAAAAPTPSSVAKLLYRHRGEMRIAKTAIIPLPDAEEIGDPSDSEIRSYYEANISRYTAPERRAIAYLMLTAEELAPEITIEDDILRAAFERRRDEFSTPERRLIHQMVSPDFEAAQELVEAVAGGESFEAAAERLELGAPLDLGFVTREELLSELAEPAFALAEGAVGEPVQSAFGWHVLTVRDVQFGEEANFADARAILNRAFALERAADALVDMQRRVDDTLAAGEDLEAAAHAVGAETISLDSVSRQGAGPDGDRDDSIPAALIALAFDTDAGRTSLIEELPEGGFFVIRTDRVIAPAARPLEQVRDEVIAQIKEDRSWETAERMAEAFAQAVRDGADLDALAAERGFQTGPATPFLREGPSPDAILPSGLAATLFEKDEGDVVIGPSGQAYIVGELTEIRRVPNPSNEDLLSDANNELRNAIASDFIEQFIASVIASTGVEIDREALSRTFGPGQGAQGYLQ